MTFVEENAKAWSEIPHLTKLSDSIPETVNGPGATMAATKDLRAELPKLFDRYNIKTVLDVGCGDWNWMKHIDLSGLDSHTGWDVDETTITGNQRRYRDRPNVTFQCQNLLTATDIPKVDLIIARHLLIHFPNVYTHHVLENFKASGSTYLLSSTWPGEENSDEQPDGFAYRGYMERFVNLEGHPFNLPEPLDSIEEPPVGDAVLRYRHYLALFKLPARAFHTRVHPADESDETPSISFMDSLARFKERVDASHPEAVPQQMSELRQASEQRLDRLRQVRDHLREIHEVARNDDSVGTMWLLLGAQITAVDAMLQYLIGEEREST